MRYTVAGLVNVPTTSVRAPNGRTFAVALLEETVSGGRECADYCDGCCDQRGRCYGPEELSHDFCALDQPGGACGACSGLATCEDAVCQEPDPADLVYDLDLDVVRMQGYSWCDTIGGGCEFAVFVSWVGGPAAGTFDSAGDGPEDSDYAAVGIRLGRRAPVGSIQRSMDIRVYDRDVTEDEFITRCSVRVGTDDLQRAMEAAGRGGEATFDAPCGAGVYLTFSLGARRPSDDGRTAGRW
jgi:hypothetical protein